MSMFKTKDQTELYFHDLGTGDPVILIHGWPLTSAMWESQCLALREAGKRVIAYDRRGFGKSDQSKSGKYDYDILASDLNDLIEHLQLQSVSLVGFSMGGGEIARYLGTYGSKKIAKTVLVSAVVPKMLKTESNPEGVPSEKFSEMKKGVLADRPHFLAAFNKDFFGATLVHSPVSNEMLMWTSFLAYQASLKATVDCIDSFGKTDFTKDMAAFTMPTLIIQGTADKIVPIKTSGEAAAKLIKGSTFKPIDGAPHGLFITHKNQLNEELCSFL